MKNKDWAGNLELTWLFRSNQISETINVKSHVLKPLNSQKILPCVQCSTYYNHHLGKAFKKSSEKVLLRSRTDYNTILMGRVMLLQTQHKIAFPSDRLKKKIQKSTKNLNSFDAPAQLWSTEL